MGAENKKLHQFILLKNISGVHYIIHLSESIGGAYQLNFKTEEYEYATTNLDKNSQEELYSTINLFLKSLSEYTDANIDEISLSPADASYSAEEIEKCIQEILVSSKNELTREQLISRYNGFRIFDRYYELFHKDFLPVHYTGRSRAKGRSRLFQMMIKKHFPDWVIEESNDWLDSNFSIKRKKQF